VPHNPKLPFSVAKFTIEGVGQGGDQSHIVCSAPPRLPGPQTDLILNSDPVNSFSTNPFSLSRDSQISSACPSVPQISVATNCNTVSSSASLSLASPSSHVHSLFPNPFLLRKNLNSQPAISSNIQNLRIPPRPSTQSSPQIVVQPVPYINILPTPGSFSVTLPISTRKPRKPRPDRLLAPSPFRPRVMAVDRLLSWRTPYGLSHDQSLLAELPPALAESAKMSIAGALAPSSRSSYAAGLLRFNQFCDKWQISEGARMPASYALLCAFIGNYKGTTSGKTIKSWLSGIRAWHLTNHAPWYGDDNWVKMARTSANKEGSRHKRPLRAPVSIEHLLALRHAITLSDHFHAAVWAVALVTFFGCRRLGEITVNSISSFDPSFHVLRSAEYVSYNFSSLLIFT
jgi:hypothetical protein